jgi:hypothetical protein
MFASFFASGGEGPVVGKEVFSMDSREYHVKGFNDSEDGYH